MGVGRYGATEGLTIDRVRDVLKAAKKDQLYAFYVLVLCVGLRRGELLGAAVRGHSACPLPWLRPPANRENLLPGVRPACGSSSHIAGAHRHSSLYSRGHRAPDHDLGHHGRQQTASPLQ
ncbi:hypothetical protein [Actinomadura rugatobispora]|uniref:hypothetical protein n=1 Tax=Actinomadura rugatobispora TaxID=1994 RepID=UPI00366D28E6|nr:hypothetical protein GCM10010200_015530 [Actinomadura rugatobispora]